ncbi:YggS family pyridoxal phosphate-dependent enzyme [Helicobacter sp. 11S02596-1]|uniref:YggS family pyridoxal phosphate-dependent enzyme n=1 Tax=Helicobacter sp. 11S02596-1 TaxID=1476194 RepID=UPI000BA6BD4E|nr:YggS family pyridoxal phosphate-dependent enzyme [Helicobacter sp. 11S02596-1]PAF41744.1 YggS family pyridoxal phosphate enzyme [Helicobacter sp. 11S02596-1]
MNTFAKNLDAVIAKIEKARIAYSRHHIIQLIAVSKYATACDIKALYECGQRAFGENKVQDLKAKAQTLDELPLQWHMIGTLQENKINALLALKPTLVHSLDSFELALAIQKRCENHNMSLNALLQINAANEPTKSGVKPEVAQETYLKIAKHCPNIKLEGLMTIGANSPETKKIEQSFQITKDIFDGLKPNGARILSMGMSGDFEIAISCGANMLRIGSALFQK